MDWDTYNEEKQQRKQGNMKANLDYLNEHDVDYVPHNNGYQLNIEHPKHGVVSFYPSTNKWVFRGKLDARGVQRYRTFHGNAEEFVKWLKTK